jgi:hypothetical protein
MQFNKLIVTKLFDKSIKMRDSDSQLTKLIVECLVVYKPDLKISNICYIIFDRAHQKFNESFLMITVSENIPYVGEVKFTSFFGNFIRHYTIEQGLHVSILKEGQMALNVRFTRLNQIISLNVLVL